MLLRLAADAVLLAHAALVAFVVVGQVLIVAGLLRGWRWVRNLPLRLLHLLAIAVVVVQAWTGIVCPLTTLENTLRRQAGQATYPGGFIAHWVHALLFYEAPGWVFTMVYTLFGAMVVATWVFGRPRPRSRF